MLGKMRLTTESELKKLQFNTINEKVYIIELDKVIEERCDELDTMLEYEGHEIIHREYITIATSIFNYKVYFI